MRFTLSCLLVAAAAVGLPATTWAFFPTFAREVGGHRHRASDDHPPAPSSKSCPRSYGITKTTKSIDEAIETICKGNTRWIAFSRVSSKHFDGENFLGGQECVAYERDIAITAAERVNLRLARLALGRGTASTTRLLQPLQLGRARQ